MASWMNRILKGQKASYQLLGMLKEPSLYKASVLPPSLDRSNPPPTNNFVAIKDLVRDRELRAHQLPVIQGCKYIRQVVDIIEKGEQEDWAPSASAVNRRMVLEWMDTDLWLIRPFGKPFSNPKLPAIVTKSILEALVVFHELRGVHTGVLLSSSAFHITHATILTWREPDVNPNNIFLSDLESPSPTVKLGDLDNTFSEGAGKNYQGGQTNETRAPEVWRGEGIWHSSDIWSLGVTITHWLLSATLFGPRDKIIEDNQTAWCLAKIFRLVGNIESPENPELKDDFDLARALEGGGYLHPKTGEPKPYISVGTLREELSKLPREICSETCIDFLENLLVIDPAKRPTAELALKHPFVDSIII